MLKVDETLEGVFKLANQKQSIVVSQKNIQFVTRLFDTANLHYADYFPNEKGVDLIEFIRSIIAMCLNIAPAIKTVEALKLFITESLRPNLEGFNYSVRDFVNNSLCIPIFAQYLPCLRRVFTIYALEDCNQSGEALNEKSTISLSTFMRLCKKYKLCRIESANFTKTNSFILDQLVALVFGVSLDLSNSIWKSSLCLTWPEFLLSQANFAVLNSNPVCALSDSDTLLFPPKFFFHGWTELTLVSLLSAYFDSIDWPEKDTLLRTKNSSGHKPNNGEPVIVDFSHSEVSYASSRQLNKPILQKPTKRPSTAPVRNGKKSKEQLFLFEMNDSMKEESNNQFFSFLKSNVGAITPNEINNRIEKTNAMLSNIDECPFFKKTPPVNFY